MEARLGSAPSRPDVHALLRRVVERLPVAEAGAAYSGASLERVRLDDGRQFILKRFSPATDIIVRLTGDQDGRSAALWATGSLDRLPADVDHTIVAAERDGDGWIMLMRDVSDAMVPGEHQFTLEECRRVFAALASMHRSSAGEPIAGACSLGTWVRYLHPAHLQPHRGSGFVLPDWVLGAWERFFVSAPLDIAAILQGIHADPSPLVRAAERHELTLIHGDVHPGNLGLYPDRLALFDWALATQGPGVLDCLIFIAETRYRISATPEELLEAIRAAYGDRHEESILNLALLMVVANYVWLWTDRRFNASTAERAAREAAWLEWWFAKVLTIASTDWQDSQGA